MDADTEIDLDVLQDGMAAAIAAQFPSLVTVACNYETRSSLPVPACLIELTELEPAPDVDPGTQQLAVRAQFSARLVLGFRTSNVRQEIRKLAGSLGAFLHQNRFSQPIGPGEVLTISPDEFTPELDQYEIWLVEWQHVVHLGKTVWTNDGVIPTQVLASWEPDTGTEHEPDYFDVTDTEPLT